MIKDIAVLSPLYVTAFWGIVLLSSYPKNKPKFLLGIFMFVSFLLHITHYFFFTENYLAYFHTESLYLFASLTLYPLYYCYIRLLTIESSFRIKNLLHFIPAIMLGLTSLITGFFFNDQQRLDYIELFVMRKNTSGIAFLSVAGIKSTIFIISRIVFLIQVFFYLLKGVILTQQHEKRIARFYSNTEGKSIQWVRMVTFSFFVTSIMSFIFAIIGRNVFLLNANLLLIPSITFSLLLYFIGYLGNRINQVILEPSLTQSQLSGSQINYVEKMREKFSLLLKDDKIFKSPELILSYLSDTLNAQNPEVSLLINEEFKTDFRNFANKYRIAVAKELIVKSINSGISLEAVAVESGFDSMNTFTRVFKDYEGITPQIYKEMSGQREFPL